VSRAQPGRLTAKRAASNKARKPDFLKITIILLLCSLEAYQGTYCFLPEDARGQPCSEIK
jgi:hypothetical protein